MLLFPWNVNFHSPLAKLKVLYCSYSHPWKNLALYVIPTPPMSLTWTQLNHELCLRRVLVWVPLNFMYFTFSPITWQSQPFHQANAILNWFCLTLICIEVVIYSLDN